MTGENAASGATDATDASDAEKLAELRAAFARGDYGATREGARRLAKTAEDDVVRAAARELAGRTGASRGMVAVYLAVAALVVAISGYWLTTAR